MGDQFTDIVSYNTSILSLSEPIMTMVCTVVPTDSEVRNAFMEIGG